MALGIKFQSLDPKIDRNIICLYLVIVTYLLLLLLKGNAFLILRSVRTSISMKRFALIVDKSMSELSYRF